MYARKNILTAALLFFISISTVKVVSAQGIPINGFVQGLWGGRLQEKNPTSSDYTASEVRLQLRMEHNTDIAEVFARADFFNDEVVAGGSDWELREGFAKFTLFGKVDFKVGRQILTWGTGDLIFINDVFAKDYESFFAGREDQYLKAPQTALRSEYYSPLGELALVWTPRFAPNRTPATGRFSYYSPMSGDFAAEPFAVPLPAESIRNSELAGRFQKTVGGMALALYGYKGFFKNPVGFDFVSMMPFYPRLNIYGASARGQAGGGVFWLEGGYFHSYDDQCGEKPGIPNSNIQGLVGFEKQIASDITANIQYQAEKMLQYERYERNLVGNDKEDEFRSLVTSRITGRFRMETIILSSFIFWSPTDEDLYYRFSADYKLTDNMTVTVGGNIFDGNRRFTDFGMFQLNDNLYARATYGF
ncbi:MAG: hypothetical protein HRF51_06345 [bacterium]|jgi:hypothetical protein